LAGSQGELGTALFWALFSSCQSHMSESDIQVLAEIKKGVNTPRVSVRIYTQNALRFDSITATDHYDSGYVGYDLNTY